MSSAVRICSFPRSLIEHLGTGRHYNINSKRGKLHILTAEDMSANSAYNSDICTYMFNMQSIEEAPDPYVIIAPPNMVYRQDLDQLLQQHQASGADISVLYQNVDNAEERVSSTVMCCGLNRQKGVLSIDQQPRQCQEPCRFLRNIHLVQGAVHLAGQESSEYKLYVLVQRHHQ